MIYQVSPTKTTNWCLFYDITGKQFLSDVSASILSKPLFER